MRDPKRIDVVLEEIKKIWEKYPDLRLGQLLENASKILYYEEDQDLVEKLKQFYDDKK
jgi:uncharacterized protein YihD (DUF1040 family)